LDSSGYYTHAGEWSECVKVCDASLVMLDGTTGEENLCFIREFIVAIKDIVLSANRPAYFLVNHWSGNPDVKKFALMAAEFFSDISYQCLGIEQFNDEVFRVFDWFETFRLRTSDIS
jgi:hypothetical protein